MKAAIVDRTPYISLLLSVIAVYAIGFFLPAGITSSLSLIPSKVIGNLEFWRIFTFPLAAPDLPSILLFAFVMIAILPYLAMLIRRKDLVLLSGLIILLQGMLFSVIFSDTNYTFSGNDGLSFYYIFLYAGFRFYPKFSKMKYHSSKITLITLLVVLAWSSLAILNSDFNLGTNYINSQLNTGLNYSPELFESLASAVFGINLGIISYFMIRAGMQKRKRKLFEQKLHNYQENQEEAQNIYEFVMSHTEHLSRKNNSNTNDDILGSTSYYEFNADEDTLNQILDKISGKGQESLTYNERRYLEDYSKHLK